jgi:hypothetical protein
MALSNQASPRKSAASRHAAVPSRPVKQLVPGRIATDSRSRRVLDRTVAVDDSHELPTGADITDPGLLLEGTPPSRPQDVQQAPAPTEGRELAEPEEEPPSSTVRPVFGSFGERIRGVHRDPTRQEGVAVHGYPSAVVTVACLGKTFSASTR